MPIDAFKMVGAYKISCRKIKQRYGSDRGLCNLYWQRKQDRANNITEKNAESNMGIAAHDSINQYGYKIMTEKV